MPQSSLSFHTPDLTAADLHACQTLLRSGSRSFHVASLLLPRRVCRPATALYAFCRVADDLIDDAGNPSAGLQALHRRLDDVYAGTPRPAPEYAPDRALAAVVARHAIPRAVLDALLDGFAWDASGRQYETLDDVLAYAARVAGTVGAAMAVLMGARSAEAVARACDLGMAMQLSNIARDVGEDARAGRLYLPRASMRAAGLDPDRWLADPHPCPALAAVVAEVLHAAEALYARADAGIAVLPLSCRPGIGTARRLYAAIGHRVAAAGHDSVTARARVTGRRKLLLALRSTARAVLPRPAFPGASHPAAPHPAARFLVDAVLATPARAPLPTSARPLLWRGFDDRVAWLCALYERLDMHQRQAS